MDRGGNATQVAGKLGVQILQTKPNKKEKMAKSKTEGELSEKGGGGPWEEVISTIKIYIRDERREKREGDLSSRGQQHGKGKKAKEVIPRGSR